MVGPMNLDPVDTNPDHYRVVFENERVRVWSTGTDRETARRRTSTPTA